MGLHDNYRTIYLTGTPGFTLWLKHVNAILFFTFNLGSCISSSSVFLFVERAMRITAHISLSWHLRNREKIIHEKIT